MNTITINGTKISASGDLHIINGNIFVDGKNVTPDAKQIEIVVEGKVEYLQVDGIVDKIRVIGDVGNVKTVSGDVVIEHRVVGDVKTVTGNIDCGDVHGSIKTVSGNIKYRKIIQSNETQD